MRPKNLGGFKMKELSAQTKTFLDSIGPFDEFGFQIRPHHYWLPEPLEDEIERLEWNLAKYEQYLYYKSRFPKGVIQARLDDFTRLQVLKKRVA